MRRSTIGLAVFFLGCLTLLGVEKMVQADVVRNTVSACILEMEKEGFRNFLKWRNPGIYLTEDNREKEQQEQREQLVYDMKAENDGWKERMEKIEQENAELQEADETDVSNENNAQKGDGENESQTPEEKRIPFTEYIQTVSTAVQARYTWNQLTDFDFLIDQFYQVHKSTSIYPSQLNGESILKTDLTISHDGDGPEILIYHTHGSEYFKDSDPDNPDTLITGVGEELCRILTEKYGYRVLHDTTVFPYNSSYTLGRKKAEELLETYPSIQVILDLHRDASPKQHLVTEIDGKPTAQIMFFNGMCQTKEGAIASRKNENLETNLAFSLQMKLAAEELYPGFTRKNYLKAYRYNMDLAGRYALIEVGAETNTLEEEINAMEPLAEILHVVLQ